MLETVVMIIILTTLTLNSINRHAGPGWWRELADIRIDWSQLTKSSGGTYRETQPDSAPTELISMPPTGAYTRPSGASVQPIVDGLPTSPLPAYVSAREAIGQG